MKKVFYCVVVLLCCLPAFSADILYSRPYDKTADKTGTVLVAAVMVSSALLLKEGPSELPVIGTMGLETFVLTAGIKEGLKHLVVRNRPYTYFPDAPADKFAEWTRSFPSGHAAYAFAFATFTGYVFCKYNPDSRARLPVCIGLYALATAAACLRVASGSHFVTDVLAGAAIGTITGFAVPFVHTLFAEKNVSGSVSPFGFILKLKL